jgi:hypothetical protein
MQKGLTRTKEDDRKDLSKINLVPLPSPFNISKGKKTLTPSLATQERKKRFMKKSNPLPFLLAHVKGRRKKNINLHPLPFNSKRNLNK